MQRGTRSRGDHDRRRAESVRVPLASADVSDYNGAHEAGLEARLIRRVGGWSDGAARKAGEDLTGVMTIQSLTEVVDEVRRRNKV